MVNVSLCGLTLAACRMCLAAHPQKQALVAQELQRLGLLATLAQPEPRHVSPDDLPKLQYLDAVRHLSLVSAS